MSKFNVKNELIEGEEIWVSCSGGIDSIAGAHYLLKKLKLQVKLFHYNHNLRDQNDEMEEAVRKFAADYNLPIVVKKLTQMCGTGEAELRHNRYLTLQAVANQGTVVTCHHLDDCIESYLMNCFNGTPEYSPIPVSTKFGDTQVVRPFLLTPKKVFSGYASAYNLDEYIVEDETNQDQKYRRNWVRHRARPVIEEHYPGIRKVVLKKVEDSYRKFLYEKKMSDPRTGYVWEGK